MTRDAAARVRAFKRRTERQRSRVVLHVLDADTAQQVAAAYATSNLLTIAELKEMEGLNA